MRLFFERLESDRALTSSREPHRLFKVAEEDPYRSDVEAYLDERSRPSAGGPTLLPPYYVIADIPLHQARRREQELPCETADLETPASGSVRLFSDALLDRALAMVPEPLRSPEATMLPPFVYARFVKGSESERELTGATGRKSRMGSFVPISETVFSVRDNRTGWIVVIGEIGLADLPRRSVEHSELLTHTFFGSACPFETAAFVHAFSGDRVVPASVLEAVRSRARRVEDSSFSIRQLDLMLVHQVLHECAEILWHVVPDSFRSRWKKLFPLGQDEETSGVYFRNLLRIYTEGAVGDSAEFFASESFADVMALYWASDVPEVLRELNGGLVAKHRSFFDDVMAWVLERRRKMGSAFVLGE
jgi:hypothetical protein